MQKAVFYVFELSAEREDDFPAEDELRQPRQLYGTAENSRSRSVQREYFKARYREREHWHNTKWEFFIVVSGHGLIQERKIGTEEVMEFEVSGDKIQAVHMLPGYTHNIINLSDTEDLVTVMWASEQFDQNYPDTFGEKVKT